MQPVRAALPALAALSVVAAVALGGLLAAPSRADADGLLLVALRADAGPAAAARLESVGGRLVDAQLRLWEVVAADAGEVVGALREDGAVRFTQPVRTYAVAASAAAVDPLSASEWWRADVGLGALVPPGPGIPVTIVDSGISVEHPEFAGRADLEVLNEQEPAPLGGEHGTMVASVVGAPENGQGVVGIYPQAVLRSWDAAKGQGTQLDSIEIVNGILAAARKGRGVINLSLGGPRDLAIEYATEEAVARGSLVVAASGNDGDRGSPLGYPAALPHVVTAAATDRSGAVAAFSSRSPYVDVAAPGDEITVASALSGGWRETSGTSFSSPLVAGAAAWIWTARPQLDAGQVAEIIRRSARDIGPPGRDPASGFGVLDVGAALSLPAPTRDPGEPNDDMDNVDPNGDRNYVARPPLTTATTTRAAFSARVDRWEDPRDIYRLWLPARKRVTITATSAADVDLGLYRTGVPTVVGPSATDYRLARARTRGTTERLVFQNPGAGRWAYVAVSPHRSSLDATYRLVITSR
jgi:subtilisin family serine protease